jgi:hypothetical protein
VRSRHALVESQLLIHREHETAGVRDVGEIGRDPCRWRERFLTENMAARFQCRLHDRRLGVRGDGDVDDVHALVVQQIGEGVVNRGDAVPIRSVACARLVDVEDAEHLEAAGAVGRQVCDVDDGAGSDNGDRQSPISRYVECARVRDLGELLDHVIGPRVGCRR